MQGIRYSTTGFRMSFMSLHFNSEKRKDKPIIYMTDTYFDPSPILTAHYNERENKVRYYYLKTDVDGEIIRVYTDEINPPRKPRH